MHRRWWQDRHSTTVQCKIGSNNLLVCLRGHLIGATRSHELQEGTLADQGDPSDHSKILGEGPTVVSRFDWIQSMGLTHRKSIWFNLHVLLYCRIRGISYHKCHGFRGPFSKKCGSTSYAALPISILFLREESYWQRYSSSYLHDYSGDMQYSTSNLCVQNPIFPHFVMVIMLCCGPVWFVGVSVR
jgi:hypothetical protein